MNIHCHEKSLSSDYQRMEHRLSVRKPCKLSVTIRYRDIELPFCTIRDGSLDGFAVDTNLLWLPQGIAVEVIADSPDSPGSIKLVALVIHSDPGRAGLWVGDDTSQQELLQVMMTAKNTLSSGRGMKESEILRASA